jgi:hypothetical protein
MNTRAPNLSKIHPLIALALLSQIHLPAADAIHVTWPSPSAQFATPPVFPTNELKSTGSLIVKIGIDQTGKAKTAKIVSGADELRPIVLTSAKAWRFNSSTKPPSEFLVYLHFTQPGGMLVPPAPRPQGPPFGSILGAVEYVGFSDTNEKALAEAMRLRVGDVLTEERHRNAFAAGRKIEPNLTWRMTPGAQGTISLRFTTLN